MDLFLLPAPCAVPSATDRVTERWHVSVVVFEASVRCSQGGVCGRGSGHVLRPSAPLSILVCVWGGLACGGPTRVTGKQQNASCERACSGEKNSSTFTQWAVFCIQGSHSPPPHPPRVQEPEQNSCTRATDDIHNENVLLGTGDCLCEPFGWRETSQ